MLSSVLTSIQNQLPLYGYPIFIILGNIGHVFIIILFSQQRQTACSIYLISSAVVNFVYLTFSGSITIFPFNYSNGSLGEITVCKISSYLVNIIGQIGKTMLVLACMDRFLITSRRVSFRAFSTPKRANYLVFFTSIFWLLAAIHIPITRTVINGQCTYGVYSTIYSIYSILFVGLIPTITLAIFAYLAYHNMKQINVRVHPVVQNTTNGNIFIQRRDRDFLIIIIAEVVTYVVTTALFPLIQLEMMISQYVIPNKSVQYLQIERFILSIAYFLLLINSAAPFYTYLISSKSFRRAVKQLILNIYRKITRQTPVETVSRIDRTLKQQETCI